VRDQPLHAHDAIHQTRALATLLLKSSQEEAFNPSSAGLLRSDSANRQAGLRHPHLKMSSPRDSWADKSDLITQVEEQIVKKPTALVIRNGDSNCEEVKKHLTDLGATPELIMLDFLDKATAAEVEDHLETLTGARTVPQLFISQRFFGTADKIMQAAEDGSLKKLCLKAYKDYHDDLNNQHDISIMGKTNREWKKELKPKLYNSLRLRSDEFPFTHRFAEEFPDEGYYACAGCGLPLFSAESKYQPALDNQRGWPAFDMCLHSEEIGCHLWTRPDGIGDEGLEIACRRCGGHIGHVYFDDERDENPNGERNSANGLSLKYHAEELSDDVWERKVTLVKT